MDGVGNGTKRVPLLILHLSQPAPLQHEWFVTSAKDKEADVLFIGGDHVALLEQSQFYAEHLAPLHCLCFGSFGDSLANLMWRVENGEVENFSPKCIVVSVGESEDLRTVTPDDFLSGLKRLAHLVREKQPKAELLVMHLLPSGRRDNAGRRFVSDVNARMAEVLGSDVGVVVLDASTLIDQNGELDSHLMFDFLHLSQDGYRRVFFPVLEAVGCVLNT